MGDPVSEVDKGLQAAQSKIAHADLRLKELEIRDKENDELKAIQLEISKADLKLKELEIKHKPGPWRALFTSPVFIGAVITGYIAAASSYFTTVNARRQMEVDTANKNGLLELERLKFRSSLVLDAIKTGSHDQAAANLAFLMNAGLLNDQNGQLKDYLRNRVPNAGVGVPTPIPQQPSAAGANLPPESR